MDNNTGIKQRIELLVRDGRLAEAERLSARLSNELPRDPDAWLLRAAIMARKNDLAGVVEFCERALEAVPGYVPALYNLAVALQSLHEPARAESLYLEIIGSDPGHIQARVNLCILLRSQGRHKNMLEHAENAVICAPQSPSAQNILGLALKDTGNLDAAIECFRRALQYAPDFRDAHHNLGLAYLDRQQPEQAARHLQHALNIDPGNSEVLTDMGMAMYVLGRPVKAIEYYRKALTIAPENRRIHINLSTALLLLGKYPEGWKEYEWRLRTSSLPPYRITALSGDSMELNDRNVLVLAEQGIGDEIMFASCFNDLLGVAGRVVLQCDPRLQPIFERSFPGARVQVSTTPGIGDIPHSQDIDICIPAGSLPGIFRKSAGDFPCVDRYLFPDEVKGAIWKEKLEALGEGIKIGIAWRGGKDQFTRQLRSIPLSGWEPLLTLPGVIFIDLQYGDHRDELNRINACRGICIHALAGIDPLAELDDFFALLSQLDLVISVDNATVHMAGALGTETRVLLTDIPEWRWQVSGDRSPWYANLRLIRQAKGADRTSVIREACSELRDLL